MWPAWGITQAAGKSLVTLRGGCLVPTGVSRTPPHPLSPQPGKWVLQGGEVLVFPIGSLPSLTLEGGQPLLVAGPLHSFWTEDYEARTAVGALQAQVGDYGLKFQQEPKGRGSWAQPRAAWGGRATLTWPSFRAGHWSFLRGLMIQPPIHFSPPRVYLSVRRPKDQGPDHPPLGSTAAQVSLLFSGMPTKAGPRPGLGQMGSIYSLDKHLRSNSYSPDPVLSRTNAVPDCHPSSHPLRKYSPTS